MRPQHRSSGDVNGTDHDSVSQSPTNRATPHPVAAGDRDEVAIIALAKRDPAAFAPLYQEYLGPVYRYCYRRLGSREAAEDATSLVFERALRALPTFRGASFRAWLFTIAHNAVTDAYRRRGATPIAGRSPGDRRSSAAAGATCAAGRRTAAAGDGAGALARRPAPRHRAALERDPFGRRGGDPGPQPAGGAGTATACHPSAADLTGNLQHNAGGAQCLIASAATPLSKSRSIAIGPRFWRAPPTLQARRSIPIWWPPSNECTRWMSRRRSRRRLHQRSGRISCT